jgi:hypothetical protein
MTGSGVIHRSLTDKEAGYAFGSNPPYEFSHRDSGLLQRLFGNRDIAALNLGDDSVAQKI